MGIFTVSCPNCGSSQKRTKTKCTECGTTLPHVNRNCWNCSRSVGAESKFCWKCGADLSKSNWQAMLRGSWQRKKDILAIKVLGVDIPGNFGKTISIEPGTKALLVVENEIAGELDSGEHTLESIIGLINRFGRHKKITVILVADQPFTIPFSFDGVRTADERALNISADVVLRVADIETLYLQLLAAESVVTIDDINDDIKKDVETGMKLFVHRISEMELYDNPSLANEMAVDVRNALNEALNMSGLELIGVKNLRARNEKGEELRQKADEINFADRMRVMLTDEEIVKIKEKGRLREFIESTDQEHKIKVEIRDDEYKNLQSQLEFARDKEDVLRAIEITFIRDDAKREEAMHQFEHDMIVSKKNFSWEIEKRKAIHTQDLTERKENYAQNLTERKENHTQEINELDSLLDIRKKKKEIDRVDELERLKAQSSASIEALISTAKDTETARILAETLKTRVNKDMSADQMLALAAQSSPALAEAIAKGKMSETELEKITKRLLDVAEKGVGRDTPDVNVIK